MNFSTSTKRVKAARAITPFHIAFEGIDGCGKDSQIQRLQQYLRDHDVAVVQIEDPGAGNSLPIRELLLNKQYPLTTMQQLLLFTAARVAAVDAVRKALEAGQCVISSRWVMSTYVYQGLVGKLGLPLVKGLHSLCVAHDPHLTVLLDVPAAVARRRIQQRDLKGNRPKRYHASTKDRFESQGLQFARKLRNGYLEVSSVAAGCTVVNGNQSPEKVAKAVLAACHKQIPWFWQTTSDE